METDGDARCGGDDFDLALYDFWDAQARSELGGGFGGHEGGPDLHFLRDCRRRKESLSHKERIESRSLLRGGTSFKVGIDRTTFEGLIGRRVEETVERTKTMIERAEHNGQSVDTLVLIGGSTKVPLVSRRLGEALSLKPLRYKDQDMAVALGAAYHARQLWSSKQSHHKASPVVKREEMITRDWEAFVQEEARADEEAITREWKKTRGAALPLTAPRGTGTLPVPASPGDPVNTSRTRAERREAILRVLRDGAQKIEGRLGKPLLMPQSVYIHPDIPADFLNRAREACGIPHSEEVLGLIIMGPVWKKGKWGVIFTDEGMFFNFFKSTAGSYRYRELREMALSVRPSMMGEKIFINDSTPLTGGGVWSGFHFYTGVGQELCRMLNDVKNVT